MKISFKKQTIKKKKQFKQKNRKNMIFFLILDERIVKNQEFKLNP